MTGVVIAFFIIMIATFGLWVFTFFKFLRALNNVKKQRVANGAHESMGMTVDLFVLGFTAPEFRSQRNRVVILTIGLFAVILFGRFGLPTPQ